MFVSDYMKNINMKIITNFTIDLYYNEGQILRAKRKRRSIEKMGYDFQQTTDEPGDYAYCDQFIKTKIKVYKKTKLRKS